ncbi:MAG: hypothetical protein Q8K00_06410 [Syntrophales bacterium]|nr:hypothetical protein [Syntrophales bacterium]
MKEPATSRFLPNTSAVSLSCPESFNAELPWKLRTGLSEAPYSQGVAFRQGKYPLNTFPKMTLFSTLTEDVVMKMT